MKLQTDDNRPSYRELFNNLKISRINENNLFISYLIIIIIMVITNDLNQKFSVTYQLSRSYLTLFLNYQCHLLFL